MFYFRIEGGAAHDELTDASAECSTKFFTDFRVNDAADAGDGGQDIHVPLAEYGLDGCLVHLLKHEGNRDDDVGLDFLHGLQQK